MQEIVFTFVAEMMIGDYPTPSEIQAWITNLSRSFGLKNVWLNRGPGAPDA